MSAKGLPITHGQFQGTERAGKGIQRIGQWTIVGVNAETSDTKGTRTPIVCAVSVMTPFARGLSKQNSVIALALHNTGEESDELDELEHPADTANIKIKKGINLFLIAGASIR